MKSWTRRVADWLAPSASRDDFRTIALTFFLTTALIWVLAYGAATVFVERPDITPWHYTSIKALDVWARWDSALYIDIARAGYRDFGDGRNNFPWFPLYPMLIRCLVPEERGKDPTAHDKYRYLTGQIISLVSLFLLLCVVFDLAAQRHGKKTAHLAVLYLAMFPSALFFRAVYTESLYTLLVALSYRAFVREHYGRCGLYGALAAMTRLPGIMLLPAFGATLLWQTARKEKAFRAPMILTGLIALGLGAVMLVQWQAVGDPLAFLKAASRDDFQRSVALPGWSVLRDLKAMVTAWDFQTGRIEFSLMIDDLVAVLAVLGALYFFRRYSVLVGCLSLALILPALVSGRTVGMIRYVLPVFFYCIFLAEVGERRPWFHSVWLIVSSMLLAFYTICFACWYWTA